MIDHSTSSPFLDEYKDSLCYSQGCLTEVINTKNPYFFSPAQAYIHCGHFFYAQYQFEQALICYQQGLHLQPNQIEVYCRIGQIFYLQGHFQAALEVYQQALQIDPDYTDIYKQLEEGLCTPNQCEQAWEYCQQYLNTHQDILPTLLASILFRQNQLEQSLEYYRQALRRRPNNAYIHIQIGIILLKKGQLLEGWPEYEWRLRAFSFPLCKPLHGQHILIYWEHQKLIFQMCMLSFSCLGYAWESLSRKRTT